MTEEPAQIHSLGPPLEEGENWLLQAPSDLNMLVMTQDAPLLVSVHI